MTPTSPTLASLLDRPDNGFNLVRLAAAASVVVTHTYLLFYGADQEPLSWGPFDLGANAVNVFFVLSGLLLSRSFDHNPDWRVFAASRILRIFPALIVAGAVVAWVIAPMATGLPLADYFSDLRTIFYPILNSVLFDSAGLPQVFSQSTQPGEVDLPLWTVKYELLAYLVFGIASVCGLMRRTFTIALLTVAFGIVLSATTALVLFNPSPVGSIIRFGFCFLVGVLSYRGRRDLVLSPGLAVLFVVAALLLTPTPLGPVAWVLGLGYGALTLATLRLGPLTRLTSRWDLSFGLYIYAWPVQQLLFGMPPFAGNPGLHFAASAAIALVLAGLSWRFVERPALGLKRHVAGWAAAHPLASRSAAALEPRQP